MKELLSGIWIPALTVLSNCPSMSSLKANWSAHPMFCLVLMWMPQRSRGAHQMSLWFVRGFGGSGTSFKIMMMWAWWPWRQGEAPQRPQRQGWEFGWAQWHGRRAWWWGRRAQKTQQGGASDWTNRLQGRSGKRRSEEGTWGCRLQMTTSCHNGKLCGLVTVDGPEAWLTKQKSIAFATSAVAMAPAVMTSPNH